MFTYEKESFMSFYFNQLQLSLLQYTFMYTDK